MIETVKMIYMGVMTTFYVIKERRFIYKNRVVEIVSTTTTGKGPMDCTHKIKGSKESKSVKHEDLVSAFKAGNLKSIINS